MADTFARITSEANYDQLFIMWKRQVEQQPLQIASINNEPYNLSFTIQELTEAIKSNRNTAPGPDSIYNSMMKNTTEEVQLQLLNVFNCIWTTEYMPEN